MDEELKKYLDEKFEAIGEQFTKVRKDTDAGFTTMYVKMNQRFTEVTQRFDKIDAQLGAVAKRLDTIELDIALFEKGE